MSKKTKDEISSTLLRLMKTNKYEDLTISEITDHSDVVRKSFYNNFSSKKEVIMYIIHGLVESYHYDLELDGSYTTKAMSNIYFNFVYEHQDVLGIIIRNDLFYLYVDAFELLHRTTYPLSRFKKEFGIEDKYFKYIYSFNSQGINRLVYTWINDGCEESIEEMDDLYHKLTVY